MTRFYDGFTTGDKIMATNEWTFFFFSSWDLGVAGILKWKDWHDHIRKMNIQLI